MEGCLLSAFEVLHNESLVETFPASYIGYPVQQRYTIFFLQQEDGFHGQQVIKLKLFPFIN